MLNKESKVNEFKNLLLELCELCSQNKQSLLGKIGMKQAKLIEMFKEREGIIHNQSNNGWISVDDELPPLETVVLVYQRPLRYVLTAEYLGDSWEFSELMDSDTRVTHWQYLPEPPKE